MKPRKTPRKRPPRPGDGRPPDDKKQYRPAYAHLLVEHLKVPGQSFESFGATLYDHPEYGPDYAVGKTRLYEWLAAHPDFANAKQIGEAIARRYWDDLGHRGIRGMLRRVTKEYAERDADGNIRFDAQGNPVMLREYEPAHFAQQTYRLIMGNRFQVRETKTVEFTGAGGGPIETKESGLSDAEKRDAVRKYLATLDMIDEDQDI